MKKFDGILLLSDLDGTLIEETKKISKENIEAIEFFCKNGGLFSFATGRSSRFLGHFKHLISPLTPAIVLNGGAIYKSTGKNRILYKTNLNDNAQEVIDYVFSNHPEIEEIEATYFEKRELWKKGDDFKPQFNFSSSDILNVRFSSQSPNDIINLRDTLREKFLDFSFVRSWDRGLRMLPKNGTKGDCLNFFRENLPIHTIVAVGDFENDITLIKEADIGFAVENSAPELLKAANHIAPPVNQHVLQYIIEKIST